MTFDEIDTTDMNEDEIIDLTLDCVETLCEILESKNVPADILDSALFVIFSQRMEDAGERDEFEDILSSALEEEWENSSSKTIH